MAGRGEDREKDERGKGGERERREEGTGRGPQFELNDPRHQMAGYGPVYVVTNVGTTIVDYHCELRYR